MCNGVIIHGVDSVFTSKRLGGNQSSISSLLNNRTQSLKNFITMYNDECVEQVYRVICLYYLPPCGNVTHPLPPPSLCQEECSHVEENCRNTWMEVKLAFTGLSFIDCNDTSQLLSPLPHCCTGAGISGLFKHSHIPQSKQGTECSSHM